MRRALANFSLDSPSFPDLRARHDAYVDKTSAIADLLVGDEGMHRQTRAFFARPRKFGKSLTLDTAAEMLAAGELPAGVAPWPGRVPTDVDTVFGGLAVHARLRARDPSLRGLLQHAHFVVKMGLGEAQTGAALESVIFDVLADAAGAAFGAAQKAEVRAAGTAGGAMRALVSAVPRGVSVALLIDEYDGAIIRDVVKGQWAAADAGIDALRSLLMSTKAPDVGARIGRCLVTGVARFSRTSLFSGANNFADLTEAPLLSRALGFSEAEIRASFPEELARLAGSLGTDVDGAVAQLAHWYNGYCFDGATSCFNPYPVLVALRAGKITERELEAASGTNWLSLTPRAVVAGLAEELRAGARVDTASIDVDNLQARRVRAVPLLLQTGLLSAVAGQPAVCRAPNEYARRSLCLLIETALAAAPEALASFADALRHRNRAAFSAAVTLLFEQLPRSLFKRDSGGDVHPREAVYHAALFAVLKATAPAGVDAQLQVSSLRGVADVVVSFSGAPRAAAWVLEIGLGSDAAAKLPQAQDYATARSEPDVYCCCIVVKAGEGAEPASKAAGGAAVALAWARRVGAVVGSGATWERA
jgi:hypothetical protein